MINLVWEKFGVKQVDVFPYLKTRRLCVLLHYNIIKHWYNSTVKTNCLIKFNN